MYAAFAPGSIPLLACSLNQGTEDTRAIARVGIGLFRMPLNSKHPARRAMLGPFNHSIVSASRNPKLRPYLCHCLMVPRTHRHLGAFVNPGDLATRFQHDFLVEKHGRTRPATV